MKTVFVYSLLLSLVGCQKSEVESKEVEATLIDYYIGFVACSGGYTLQLNSGKRYAVHSWELPAPYNDETKVKLPAPVWVRYQDPTGSCSQFPGLIAVTSIRAR